MPIKLNKTLIDPVTISNVEYNGTPVTQVIFNGVVVFGSDDINTSLPHVEILSTTTTSVSWRVTNTDALAADFYTAVYNGPTLLDEYTSTNIISTGYTDFSLSNINEDVQYLIITRAKAGNKTETSNVEKTFSLKTKTPSYHSYSSTYNSMNWTVTNLDDKTATIYSELNSIGFSSGVKSQSVAAGANASFSHSTGMERLTTYYINAYAKGTHKTSSVPMEPVAAETLNYPNASAPNILYISRTSTSITVDFVNTNLSANQAGTIMYFIKVSGAANPSYTSLGSVDPGEAVRHTFSGLLYDTDYEIRAYITGVAERLNSLTNSLLQKTLVQYWTVTFKSSYDGSTLGTPYQVAHGNTVSSGASYTTPSCQSFQNWRVGTTVITFPYTITTNTTFTVYFTNNTPGYPTSATATSISAGKLGASWGTSSCATSYNVQWRRTSSPTTTYASFSAGVISFANRTITTPINVSPGTYTIQVRGVNATGTSSYRQSAAVNVNALVTFNYYSGSSSESLVLTKAYGSSLTTSDAPSNTARTGYTFNGWNVTLPTTVTGNMTITAQYTINSYTVSWYSEASSSTSIKSKSYNYGSVVPASDYPANPTKSCYVFAGWSPAAGFTLGAANRRVNGSFNITTVTIKYYISGALVKTQSGVNCGSVINNYLPTVPSPPSCRTWGSWSHDVQGVTQANGDYNTYYTYGYTVPNAPTITNHTGLLAVASKRYRRASIWWSAPSCQDGYQVRYKVVGASTYTYVTTTATSYEVNIDAASSNVEMGVQAKNSQGTYGNWSSVTFYVRTSGPAISRATTIGKLTATFSPYVDSPGRIYYQWRRGTVYSNWYYTTGTTMSMTISTAGYYYVRAYYYRNNHSSTITESSSIYVTVPDIT